jgi:hypothetical protein
VGPAARVFGVPVMVAAVALAAIGSHAKQPVLSRSQRASEHVSRHTVRHVSRPRSTRAARHGATRAPRSHPSPESAARTIVGTWDVANGIFEFHRAAAPDTFTDTVIARRPGVFCSAVNDHDDQMVLHRAGGPDSRVYTGTWAWFYVDTCKFAGYGRLTVTVWWAGKRATFVADPPAGLRGSSHMFYIDRLS